MQRQQQQRRRPKRQASGSSGSNRSVAAVAVVESVVAAAAAAAAAAGTAVAPLSSCGRRCGSSRSRTRSQHYAHKTHVAAAVVSSCVMRSASATAAAVGAAVTMTCCCCYCWLLPLHLRTSSAAVNNQHTRDRGATADICTYQPIRAAEARGLPPMPKMGRSQRRVPPAVVEGTARERGKDTTCANRRRKRHKIATVMAAARQPKRGAQRQDVFLPCPLSICCGSYV